MTLPEPIEKFRGALVPASVFLAGFLLLAAYFYRDDLFQSFMDPGEPFQTYTPPPALDYRGAAAWISRPDLSVDSEMNAGKGDIFVVTPTIYLGGKHWNAPTASPKVQAAFTRIAAPNYVTPYAVNGRVFAPLYRQASLYSFLTNRDDAKLAQQFAYQDVRVSFMRFLDNHPPERPIILIGHGQGGLHVQRLLAEFFVNESQTPMLAAAYILGHPTPLDLFTGPLKATPPCEGESDTGCVIGFGAFTPKDTLPARRFVSNSLVFEGARLTPVEGRALLCMNPLLWTRSNDYAPARLHKGGVAAEGLAPDANPAPSPRQAGAQCEDGVLVIDKPKQRSLRRPARIGGRYRTLPSNLFYEDLRQNIDTRITALIDTGVLPKRAPLMDDLIDVTIVESPVTLPKGK
ncbi:MAG: DUF3089 domain-containing protein [Robiginitomaculum sp.]